MITYIHEILNMTPDLELASSPQNAKKIKAEWENTKVALYKVLVNTQNLATKMFDAGMKLRSINSSIELMEKTLFGPDSKDPLKSIQYFIHHCDNNVTVAD
jgi:hypothetical protein